jgi:hypothetical protein
MDNEVLRTKSERGFSLLGDPYLKSFRGELEALALHQGALLQPVNPFLRLQPQVGTN